MPMHEFTERLTLDFELLIQFFKMISDPIIDIFELKEEKREAFAEEIHAFIVNRLRNSDNFCLSLRKIIRYYVKNSS